MTQPQQQQQQPEYKHPENEIALEPMDPKDVQQKQTQGEQTQEQGQAKQEPKPVKPGSFHGELSPGGQWTWKGTGAPDDAWVATAKGEQKQEQTQ